MVVLCACGCGEEPKLGNRFVIYHHNRKQPVMPLADRFWRAVNKDEDCWVWTKYRNPSGYGVMRVGNATALAHRVSWMLHNGDLAPGLVVCHKCDNPPCVRLDHLFVGTQAANVHDALVKGRLHTERRRLSVPRGDAHYLRLDPSRVQRGSDASGSKLTWELVREIREKYQPGRVSQSQLALVFGVSVSNISMIVNNQTWIESAA